MMRGVNMPKPKTTAQRTKRMHTVPERYLEAFAVPDLDRRKSAVWRFGRDGSAKLVGIRDAEVVREIYTVFREDGTPDTGIEDDILCSLEGDFCEVRRVFRARAEFTVQHFAALAKFVAMQLMRTPRSLQMIRDFANETGQPITADTPQRVMLDLAHRASPRLARMRHMIIHNETDFPLLTSDNPVPTWRETNGAYEHGVDLRMRDAVVVCPLAPDLMYAAYQTADSFKLNRDAETGVRTAGNYKIKIGIGGLPKEEAKRLNAICVEDAHCNVYSNQNTPALRRFLENRFFGWPESTRRSSF
jgi:hypothetical protein